MYTKQLAQEQTKVLYENLDAILVNISSASSGLYRPHVEAFINEGAVEKYFPAFLANCKKWVLKSNPTLGFSVDELHIFVKTLPEYRVRAAEAKKKRIAYLRKKNAAAVAAPVAAAAAAPVAAQSMVVLTGMSSKFDPDHEEKSLEEFYEKQKAILKKKRKASYEIELTRKKLKQQIDEFNKL